LNVAPKHHGIVIANRIGKHVKHKQILQQGSSFSPDGRGPKTCADSVINAPSIYLERLGKQHSDLQQVQHGGGVELLSVIMIL